MCAVKSQLRCSTAECPVDVPGADAADSRRRAAGRLTHGRRLNATVTVA